jgi:ribosomal protein L14E/L6E/L27E
VNVEKGLVVKASAGRDSNAYFVVLESDEKFAVIADGKTRRLEKPKRKNIRHLKPTGKTICLDEITNKQLKKALSEFKRITQSESGGK